MCVIGGGTPEVGFRLINKLVRFVSMYKEPLVEAVDALVAPWDQYILMYAFSLLPALQDRYRRRPSDPHYFGFAQKYSMWHANLIRLLADALWALLDPFESTVQRADLPSCIPAPGFKGMAVFIFRF